MPARYHLRFQLHPGSDLTAHATELAKFCAENGVDEVVLLVAAEELYAGHPAGAAAELWHDTAAVANEVLTAAGLTVSLNPWVTAGHADRGRVDRLGFSPMVSPSGRVATAQASFACPRWRDWIVEHYGRFAGLGLRVLWLEDDFRYHNHAPLDWGGGFEQPMLDRLAELAGEPVTRERVVAAITAPGEPHPWRALLHQVWRTAQLEVAELLADAVARRSGGRSRLGLMSSLPELASVEGRDWPALFDALRIGGEAAHRPHFAPYQHSAGPALSSSIWLLERQRALRPERVSCEPEIENWPHTAWSKPDTQTWSELVAAQLTGADALLLNLHPMHSGRAARFPAIGQLLRKSRPALDWLADQPRGETVGVGLPMPPDAAAHVRTRHGGELAELVAPATPAADFLLRYGVPVTAGEASVDCVFGQLAWALPDDEVRRLLSGGVLLDGTAAQILGRRGFADLLGVTVTEVVEREQQAAPGPYSLERLTGDDSIYLSVNAQPALARLQPSAETVVLSRILTPDQLSWGPGRCLYRNRIGGRVAVLAATAPDQLPFDDDGQRVLHAMIRFLEGDQPHLPLVTGGPHLIPHFTRTQDNWRLAIANGSADPARVRIDLPPGRHPLDATLLAPLSPIRSVDLCADGTVGADLAHYGWLVIHGT